MRVCTYYNGTNKVCVDCSLIVHNLLPHQLPDNMVYSGILVHDRLHHGHTKLPAEMRLPVDDRREEKN